MLIPSLFEQKLVRDPTLHAAVHLTLTTFEPWLRTSGMPFFPGFTDHSDLHLSEVLATAAALINDDSRDLISPSDIAVLVLAGLLHDIGMHLTEDSFRYLIASNTEHPRITAFDILSWQSLWADFLSEASRFDGRRLTLIFGDSKPLDLSHFDVNNLSERDRLLVGDFVRRHHCRLAHEIALWGVPFDAPQRKQLREVPAAFADLAGLVARSHGLELRDTLGYLQKNYALREYQGVHAVFLMGILRLADYIQIHDERANRHLLSVRRLRSPLSKLEWDVHHAIRDIRNTHEDPEALFVDALPQDARVYEKLSGLFRSIQHELDSTWAALGEVYGRYPPLNRLGLTIRRIRSSLDPPSALPGRLSFVPFPARFDTAGTDLLKLLVGPLYGDTVEIAIRELIQNAVDACSERSDWEAHHDGPAAQTIYGVEVLVEEEQSGARWVTVTDRGIGMTEEVIRNYFLRAGASFRTSDAWKKRHVDDAGRPRIHRGGRFGIGALAAFLVADEIHVTTRHASAAEDRAIAFVAKLDSDAIELRYTAAPIGTTIRLPIASESVWTRLAPSEWQLKSAGIQYWNEVDWYCLDTPPVSVAARTTAGSGKLKRKHSLSGRGSALPIQWRRIVHPDYDDIQWCTDSSVPALTCNGMQVTSYWGRDDEIGTLWHESDRSSVVLGRPSLSVFDSRALFPLNLQRTSVAGTALAFDSELTKSVVHDTIAFVLARMLEFRVDERRSSSIHADVERLSGYPLLAFVGIRHEATKCLPLLVTREGVTLLDRETVVALRPQRIWLVPESASWNVALEAPPDVACVIAEAKNSDADLFRWSRLALSAERREEVGGIAWLSVAGARLVIPTRDVEKLRVPGNISRFLVEKIDVELDDDGLSVIKVRDQDVSGAATDVLKASRQCGLSGVSRIVELWLTPDIWVPGEGSPLSVGWMEVIGQPLVPFDRACLSSILERARSLIGHELDCHATKVSKETNS